MSPRRVTQKDIAKQAGVSVAAVSFALKNHPGIPEKTRKRICGIAKELGYAPDPMLSALATYRTHNRAQSFRGTLAWLVNHGSQEYDWYNISMFREYFIGAKEGADALGYNLDVFNLNLGGIGPKRMTAILESRNIKGLLLCPQPSYHLEIDLPWHKFSAVMFGYSHAKPKLHLVVPAQYRCAAETVQHLRALGYRRIGYVGWSGADQRSENNALAGYVMEEQVVHGSLSIPALVHNHQESDSFLAWFKQHRPDAIITIDANILKILEGFNLSVPRDLGVACFALSEDDGQGLAGMKNNPRHCGRTAVNFLVSMIQRGERGIPELQQQVLVEGTWVPGNSLKKQIKGRPPV